jgi:hypothetical protein
MSVDHYGHHREGRDTCDEMEIRTNHTCDRCLHRKICVAWENKTIDHTDGVVSCFSYICWDCLNEAAGSLARYLARNRL